MQHPFQPHSSIGISPCVTELQGGTNVVEHPHNLLEWEVTSPKKVNMVIDSDASLIGWGATHQNRSVTFDNT